jgi:hypothetical protein
LNIFNRVVVVLLLIFFILVSIVSIVNEFTGSFTWSGIAASVFNPVTDLPWYVSTPLLLLVIAVCVALLLLEFHRKKRKIVKINKVGAGTAMITVETIAQQVKDAVLGIGGIKNLKTEIIPKSGGIIISMLVEVMQNINVPEKMTEIINAAKNICTEKLNIKVINTRLTITNLISDGSEFKQPRPEPAQAQNEKTDAPKDSVKQMQIDKLDKSSAESGIEITESAISEESEN